MRRTTTIGCGRKLDPDIPKLETRPCSRRFPVQSLPGLILASGGLSLVAMAAEDRLTTDPRSLIAATAAARSWRTPPSRPRASAHSHRWACDLRGGRRLASRATASPRARRRTSRCGRPRHRRPAHRNRHHSTHRTNRLAEARLRIARDQFPVIAVLYTEPQAGSTLSIDSCE